MQSWRSLSFCGLLVLGWLITSTFLSVTVRVLAPLDELTNTEEWFMIAGIHLLALLAGFSFARSSVRRSDRRRA